MVAAQFLEQAKMSDRLVDSEYGTEAGKLWDQWRKLVGAKRLTEQQVEEFRQDNGLRDWTDLGWAMLRSDKPPSAGGGGNDPNTVTRLASFLAVNMSTICLNNSEFTPMSAGEIFDFVSEVRNHLAHLRKDGWRIKEDFERLYEKFSKMKEENQERAVEVADREQVAKLVGALHDDCVRPQYLY